MNQMDKDKIFKVKMTINGKKFPCLPICYSFLEKRTTAHEWGEKMFKVIKENVDEGFIPLP